MSKVWNLEETGPSYDQKFVCGDNSGQKVWNKIKEPSKTGQD